MKTIKFLAIPFLALTLFTSCGDDDNPTPVNEEEVITRMTVQLVPVGGGNRVVLEVNDSDGDGPLLPVVTGGTLVTNTTYNGSIQLADESDPNDIEDITQEVEEEDDEHQFFFIPSNNIGTIAYSDMDDDGNPVGLSFTLTTTTATMGELTVILRHELDKNAAGVSSGDITNAGGETDISVDFDINVQ